MASFTNLGKQSAVIMFGKQPSNLGPSGNGYSVLLSATALKTSFLLNEPGQPLQIDTVGTGGIQLSWRIKYEYQGRHGCLGVSMEATGKNEEHVGDIMVMKTREEPLEFWVGEDSLVIGNDDKNLGNSTDGKPHRFVIATYKDWRDGLKYSDNPASLATCIKASA